MTIVHVKVVNNNIKIFGVTSITYNFYRLSKHLLGVNEEEILWIKRWATNYILKGDQLCFKEMMVPKLDERNNIVLRMHKEIGHFGEQQTLT
jgi:hypothetical protein